MLTDFSVIEGAYLRDLLDQPESLSATLASLHTRKPLREIANKLQRSRFHCIVLTGMGSSFHALHPTNVDLIRHGLIAMMVETSELVHYKRQLLDPKTLIIAVSQSGQSAEVVRLLQINRRKSTIIAVTNTADSPLARNANATLLTQAGNEFSVSCKTYVTTLMALRWLTDLLCGCDLRRTHRELGEASPLVRNYLKTWKDHTLALDGLFAGTRNLFLLGRGASLAAVGAGALVVKESDHFPAEGMSSAAFRHGPFEMIGREIFVLVFAGDRKTLDLNRRLVEDIREQGGRTELVGEDTEHASLRLPVAAAAIHPILEILPVQMITLALAAQAGREPGRFELATKVTVKE